MRSLIFVTFYLWQILVFSKQFDYSFENGSQTSINEVNIPYKIHSLSLSNLDVAELFLIDSSIQLIDLSSAERNLVNQLGQEFSLNQIDSGRRTTGQLGIGLKWKNQLSRISYSDDLQKTSFRESVIDLSHQFELYSGATLFSFSFQNKNKDQPESYFTHPETLVGTQRAKKIQSQIVTIELEQIWTEIYRSSFSVSNIDTKGYRPQENIYQIKNAVAISDRWSYKNEIATVIAKRDQRLSEDRGYFSSMWIDQEINYEWQLDSFVGLGWSTLDESEDDPRRSAVTKLGSDQFGISFEQSLGNYSYKLLSQYVLTSNKESSVNLKGGLSWLF